MRPATVLSLEGVVFIVRAAINLANPRALFLDEHAAGNAIDAVDVMGVNQAAFGLAQLGTAARPISSIGFAWPRPRRI